MVKHPSLQEHYLAALDQLSKSAPDDPQVLAALGQKALTDGDSARAADYLSRALERGAEYPTTYLHLSEALARAGRDEEAAKVLERGVAAWPYAALLQKSLVLRYITLKQYPLAHAATKRYVELFPEDSFMRDSLNKLEGRTP